MKIRQVEELTGIPATNIRFYEKEGLLKPERKENNYREYAEEDVELLKKIKVLRMLGVPVGEIREMEEGRLSLEEAMNRRLGEIQREKQDLKQAEELCRKAVRQRLTMEEIGEDFLDEKQEFWMTRLARVLREDMTAKKIRKSQFHFQVMLMLEGAVLVNLLETILWGRIFLQVNLENVLAELTPLLLVCVLCALACQSATAAVQGTAFAGSALVFTPLFLKLWKTVEESAGVPFSFQPEHAAFFLAALGAYIFLFWLLAGRESFLPGKPAVFAGTAIGFALVAGGIFRVWQGYFLVPAALFLAAACYVGGNWLAAEREYEEETGNRFYAVTVAGRTVNVLATALAMKGRTASFGRWKG